MKQVYITKETDGTYKKIARYSRLLIHKNQGLLYYFKTIHSGSSQSSFGVSGGVVAIAVFIKL
jgi:hypothetical protein